MADSRMLPTISNMPGEFFYKGVIYPKGTSVEILENFKRFDVHPDDIFITGYVKSGNNLVKAMTFEILNIDKADTLKVEDTKNLPPAPFEFLPPEHVKSEVPRPSVLYTHLRPPMLPEALKHKKAKVIHVMRNPRDVAVSFYHFHQINPRLGHYKGSWDEFFPYFNAGHVAFGSWYSYTEDWANNSGDMNVKFLQYEDMIADPYASVRSLAEFLEKPLTEVQLEKVVQKTSFNVMKEDPIIKKIIPPYPGYMRKGKVGDWKNYFSEEQVRAIDAKCQELITKTGLTFRFEI